MLICFFILYHSRVRRFPLVKCCPGTCVMACVTFAPDKRFRMDDTHRNFPHSDTKTTFWSTLAARRVATVLGKTRQPSVESQWGNYASSPPVGAVDCPSNSGGEVSLEPLALEVSLVTQRTHNFRRRTPIDTP